jgi:hypothetical protein
MAKGFTECRKETCSDFHIFLPRCMKYPPGITFAKKIKIKIKMGVF